MVLEVVEGTTRWWRHHCGGGGRDWLCNVGGCEVACQCSVGERK